MITTNNNHMDSHLGMKKTIIHKLSAVHYSGAVIETSVVWSWQCSVWSNQTFSFPRE